MLKNDTLKKRHAYRFIRKCPPGTALTHSLHLCKFTTAFYASVSDFKASGSMVKELLAEEV